MGKTVKQLRRETLIKAFADAEQSARIVNLVYVSDRQDGITRKRKSTSVKYYSGKKEITDQETLRRIYSLVLPPAWTNVWICPLPNGHLQATGYDVRGRKQYKYHNLWIALRSHTKFSHMYEFGKALPGIRQKIAEHIEQKGLPLQKVLAAVVAIMQHTSVRIGNASYEKEYGSYGLTTLKDQHVSKTAMGVQFSFKGKKGVYQQVALNNKKLARIVQQCKDIPGKELFQYYDEDGNHYAVDSGMVNNYIKQISEGNFTAKDFRTWFGSLKALQHLKQAIYHDTDKGRKEAIIAAIDEVATHLGNTRTVCRKYYIHPAIFNCYETNALADICTKPPAPNKTTLDTDEQALMEILEQQTRISIS